AQDSKQSPKPQYRQYFTGDTLVQISEPSAKQSHTAQTQDNQKDGCGGDTCGCNGEHSHAQAVKMAAYFNSPVITLAGDGHGASFYNASDCVNNIISDYVLNPKPPLCQESASPAYFDGNSNTCCQMACTFWRTACQGALSTTLFCSLSA
ncbi:MAG: alpha/beta hydrolase, partial [Moraxella sp.]|nr:alpha/beta hydrolase [Moraxella sp.]